jgi:hypothetical protein
MCLHAEEKTKVTKILYNKNGLELGDNGMQSSGVSPYD